LSLKEILKDIRTFESSEVSKLNMSVDILLIFFELFLKKLIIMMKMED
jgi:hypothetical protein